MKLKYIGKATYHIKWNGKWLHFYNGKIYDINDKKLADYFIKSGRFVIVD